MLHIGFESRVSRNKILAIVPNEAKSIRKQVQTAKEEGLLIDCTRGRATRSVIFLEAGRVITSAISAEGLAARWKGGNKIADVLSAVDKGEGTA